MHSFIFQFKISLNGSNIAKSIDFNYSLLTEPVDFELATFTDLTLNGAKFFDVVAFTDARINRSFHFSSTKFWGQTNLNQMTCPGHVHFESVEFHGRTSFEKSFFCHSNFYTTKFLDAVCFFSNFGGIVNFYNCEFYHSCDFGCKFNADWVGDVVIPTRFAQSSSFFNCKFLGVADFRHVKFSQYVSFNRASFKKLAYFSNTKFVQECDFSDCLFEQPISFRDAEFKTHFPIFSGTILHQLTLFTAKDEYWPKTFDAHAEESRESLAIIRHTVGKQGRPEEEHYFS